ncbi:MAG: Stp1/IreP family PP2C-type Ser/Thr phosphatase, partial [Peptococcaceae bacterium]|nr:Stp1/IreP family PP2C-type Ser/Thr phosphatase [Peptococcaceae bacterium]
NANLGLFAVADGMGGCEAGEVASRVAVDMLEKSVLESDGGDNVLSRAIQAANAAIHYQAEQNQAYKGMGTTITAVYCSQEKIYIGHVGDSRAYLISRNQITLLTRDHSLVNELVRGGHISEEEAKHHPQRHVITRALGTESQVDIDILSPVIEAGDRIILCTDGLSNLVTPEEIVTALNTKRDMVRALQAMVDLALERGGSDNITVLAIEF